MYDLYKKHHGTQKLGYESRTEQRRIMRYKLRSEGLAGARQTSSDPAIAKVNPGGNALINASDAEAEQSGVSKEKQKRTEKGKKWDGADDELLMNICNKSQNIIWANGEITREFNAISKNKRTTDSLRTRYRALKAKLGKETKQGESNKEEAPNPGNKPSTNWTESEDKTLYQICHSLEGKIQWKKLKINEQLQKATGKERTIDSIKKRWQLLTSLRFQPDGRTGTINATNERQEHEQKGQDDQPQENEIQKPNANDHEEEQRMTQTEEVIIDKTEIEGKENQESEITQSEIANSEGTKPTQHKEENKEPIEEHSAATHQDAGDEVIPEYFQKIFRAALIETKKGYNRKPLRKPQVKIQPELIRYGSEMIKEYMKTTQNGTNRMGWLNALVYAAGYTIIQTNKEIWRTKDTVKAERMWFEEKQEKRNNLREEVKSLRKEIARRKTRKPPDKEEINNVIKIRKQYGKATTRKLQKVLAMKEQLLHLIEDRIKLRRADQIRMQIRRKFAKEPRMQNLRTGDRKRRTEKETYLEENQILEFWKPLIGEYKDTKPEDNKYLKEWEETMKNAGKTDSQPDLEHTRELFEETLKKGKAWKASGPDGIPLFFWKHLATAREELIKAGTEAITTSKAPFQWLAQGRTVLIYKKGDKGDPANYRPITCLNTMYKVLTGVTRRIIAEHLKKFQITPEEQRGLKEGESSCLQACLIDQAIAYDAKRRRQPLSVCWMDFRKAFDSVSHRYLHWVLNATGIPTYARKFILRSMRHWRTKFYIPEKKKETSSIKIKNGIFQGDALSPELFVLAITPISAMLKKYGEQISTSIGRSIGLTINRNHQCYIDDIKLYARSKKRLEEMIDKTVDVAKGIGINLNPSKCAILNYIPGKGVINEGLENEAAIPNLEDGKSYTYLGITQQLMPNTETTGKIAKEIIERTKQILNSELSWNLITRGIQTLVISKIKYLFTVGQRGWAKLEEMLSFAKKLDTEIRKIAVECKAKYKAAATSRFYLNRAKGGWGIPSILAAAEESVIENAAYILLHPAMKAIKHLHMSIAKSNKRSAIEDCKKILETYGFQLEAENDVVKIKEGEQETQFKEHRTMIRWLTGRLKEARDNKYIAEWQQMPLAGRIQRTDELDHETSYLWLEKSYINPKVIRNAIAAQEGCLTTRAGPTSLLSGTERNCRRCHKDQETPEHILTHCPTWLPNLYVERHNSIARAFYHYICRRYDIPTIHYTNEIPAIAENEKATIYWDTLIPTQGKIQHNRPDIVINDRKNKKILVVEFGVSTYQGLLKQREIKVNRYCVNSKTQENESQTPYTPGPNLIEELRRQHKCEVRFLPIIIGATGEYAKETTRDITQSLNITPNALKNLMEHMARSAVIGSHRIICNHLI